MADLLQISDVQKLADEPSIALRRAQAHAPYLSRLVQRHSPALQLLEQEGPAFVLEQQLAAIRECGGAREDVMATLRRAKEVAHLVIAGADLAGEWVVDQVVEALSDLADACARRALQSAIQTAWASGWLGAKTDRADLPGLFALAMGKMGAGELNYSSDIDLILLFDADLAPVEPGRIKEGMTKLARELVRLLEERTADGYVFRTDLRLRPDPGSTAPAVSTQFALGYYESVGQNWERMAHIKARVCAGDMGAGEAYLAELQPYVWRRHLDYWAIADIHSIKRQIHAHGGHAELSAPDFDVKLGRGGVREIEFFAQVQQLILGGRNPALREKTTCGALDALAAAGVVSGDVVSDLTKAYRFLRAIEHRTQMINDEQTHRLPSRTEDRARVIALAGYADAAPFERDVQAVRSRVHGVYSDLFAEEERLSGATGNLVFTGVDDDPGTVATLRQMGFGDPSRVIRLLQNWHRGSTRATRTARGRQLLTVLGPRLLAAMSESGEPDAALDRFRTFFEGLSGGVQTMSMMLAQPALTRDLIQTMAYAPKLAADLGRRPALMEAILQPGDEAEEHDAQELTRVLGEAVAHASDFEDKLNAARRTQREASFRIGYALLRGALQPADAAERYTRLADACVEVLARAAEQETLAKHAGSIGRWVVCAMGKFGGRELTAASDLDLMLIYDPGPREEPNLAARFVQRLIAALSAPTQEGSLYDVDMQLRPSGRAGPVAVRLAAFESYYRTDAWTWEFMALTRLRPVAGDRDLAREVLRTSRDALARKSHDPNLTAEVLDMRRRMARDRPPASGWDLKLSEGGLVDAEFVVQHEMLRTAARRPEVVRANTAEAVETLRDAGVFSPEEALVLNDSLRFLQDLQQSIRAACGDAFDPLNATPPMRRWLAQLMGCGDFDALDQRLVAVRGRVSDIRLRRIGALSG
jgi:[glutamine synthetase] adenylyltransferase / [glutamine synthetase]-adenylyl-L-tyrosine phosphorylase